MTTLTTPTPARLAALAVGDKVALWLPVEHTFVPPNADEWQHRDGSEWYAFGVVGMSKGQPLRAPVLAITCPYGAPGETVGVREAWAAIAFDRAEAEDLGPHNTVWYCADGDAPPEYGKERPAELLPDWAIRTHLRGTPAVKRVQDVTEQEARLCGAVTDWGDRLPQKNWKHEWREHVEATAPGLWQANGWIWIYMAEKVTP